VTWQGAVPKPPLLPNEDPSATLKAPSPYVPNPDGSESKLTVTATGVDSSGVAIPRFVSGSATVRLIRATITIIPNSATVAPGKDRRFEAKVVRAGDTSTAWSANAPGGVFTAPEPMVLTAADIIVTAKADPSAVAHAKVTLIPNAAVFVKSDTVTQGNWIGKYGSKGYVLAHMPDIGNLPPYLPRLNTSALTVYTWADPTADPRGLQKPTGADHFAATWFDSTSLTLVFDFDEDPNNDSQPRQVALYCIDWDNVGRAQQLDMLADGATTPDTQNLSAFDGGRYLVWKLTGKVRLTITRKGAANAVLSGIFLD
jgi:hypothetical protein